MKDVIKELLALGVSIGLSDREKFVEKVSGIISEYQNDPAQADKWANMIAQYLERSRDDYRLHKVIENSLAGSNVPDKKNIAELTKAIQDLTKTLEQKKG